MFSNHVGIAEDDVRDSGYQAYQQKYEPFIAKLIQDNGLEPEYFRARKGDVLIWHANLLHGGSTGGISISPEELSSVTFL